MPVTTVRSRWSSGSLIFHEAGNLGTIADILTISTSGVTVGSATNDIDFTVYCGSDTFVIDSGDGTMKFTGDVEITGDVDVSTEDIAVDQGKYIYLDGLSGSEHIRSNAVGKITITASGTGADDITLAGTVTVSDDITMSSGCVLICDDTTDSSSTTTGSLQTDGGLGVAKAVNIGTTLTVGGVVSLDDTTETSSGTTGSLHTDGGLGVAKKVYVGTDLIMAGGDIDLSNGATGTYDIILKDSVADALSIRRASTDIVVFDSSTPKVTITPATTITGALTCSAAIACDDTTDSSSTTTGSVQTDGGLGVAKKGYFGDTVNVTIAALTAGDSYSGVRVAVTAENSTNAYGCAAYFDTTITGTTAGHTYGTGSWINIGASAVASSGHIIVPWEGGIYEGSATMTNARCVFAGQYQAVLTNTPATLHAWRLNTTKTITALIAAANSGSVGYAASAGTTSTKCGDIPIADVVGHGVVYVRCYDAAG